MDNLNNIPSVGNWGDAASKLNDNFNKVKQAVTTVENASQNNKGYFTSLSALNTAFPSPKAGQTAYVYGEASSTKYYIYNAVNGAWVTASIEAPPVSVAISNYAEHGYVDTRIQYLKSSIKQDDLVKTINDYPNSGAIFISTGFEDHSYDDTLAFTQMIELPDNWGEVEYYHIPSDAYGIAFYDNNHNHLKANFPQPQDSIIIIKKIEYYEVLKIAKYLRATVYKNDPQNFKNRLIIKSSINMNDFIPKVNNLYDYSSWRTKQINNGNIVVDYNYKLIGAKGATGYSEFVDISGFNEIYWNALQSSLYGIELYNSSFSKIYTIVAGNYSGTNMQILKSVDYPNAVYCKIYGSKAQQDGFTFSISKPDTLLVPSNEDIQINSALKLKGYDSEYIYFPDDFPILGIVSLKNGTLEADYLDFKTAWMKLLPETWEYIEYLDLPSSVYGLCFYDEAGNFIKSIPNTISSGSTLQTVYKSVVPTAAYYSYSWRTSYKQKLRFKIVSKPSNRTKSGSIGLLTQETRLPNANLLDLGSFNRLYPTNEITDIALFTNNDILDKMFARIPTVVITNQSTVLAAAEMRSTGEDMGIFDLLIKRKTISGSWESQILFPYNSSTYGRPMNPCFLVDRDGSHGVIGRIYCFVATVLDPIKSATGSPTEELDCLYKYSDDDGITWSAAFSLKNKWDLNKYRAFLPSPTNGIQLENGTFVIPCMVVVNSLWRSGLMYKSPTSEWILSDPTPRDWDNESAVVEFKPNQVLLNCRNETDITRRNVYQFNFDTNKIELHISDKTFKSYINCQMSLEKISVDGQKVFLMSFPDKSNVLNANTNNSRYNFTIWASLDCFRWVRVYVVNHDLSRGYGVLNFYKGKLVLVYEKGDNIEVNYQELTPLLPSIKKAVNVELSLTIEEITNIMIYNYNGWNY